MAPELTTVSEDSAVVFDGTSVARYDGLSPDTEVMLDGVAARTLARPGGQRLATIATTNDVHFGETECGMIEGFEGGPILSAAPGEPPYPETMNRAAVGEIKAMNPDAVVVKGDLTTHGTVAEYDQFRACYEPAFGDKLVHVRGNHDGYYGETFAADAPRAIDLPGVTLAVLDTVIPRATTGQVTPEQIQWLDELGSRADRPVLVFGHHHVWSPVSRERPDAYFGINPDHSEALIEVFARRPRLVGYFAGHTHRNRVRYIPATDAVPWVEVACVKDFPGAYAEYRVFEGGILQVMHRIAAPAALEWTERTRAMFAGLYPQYAFGAIADRCFRVC